MKFRAWDLDNHLMYFSDKEQENGEGLILWEFLNGDVVFSEPTIIDRYCPSRSHIQLIEYRQPNQKVMCCVGLSDSKGLKIYEGDIIESNQYIGTYTVVFRYGAFGLLGNSDARGLSNSLNNCFFPFKGDNPEQLKVIGNAYQNKELLNSLAQKSLQSV